MSLDPLREACASCPAEGEPLLHAHLEPIGEAIRGLMDSNGIGRQKAALLGYRSRQGEVDRLKQQIAIYEAGTENAPTNSLVRAHALAQASLRHHHAKEVDRLREALEERQSAVDTLLGFVPGRDAIALTAIMAIRHNSEKTRELLAKGAA